MEDLMHHVDRNSGILNPEESLSPDQRRDYQGKFLRDVVALAYSSGTPLKKTLEDQGAQPGDITSIEDLRKIPILKKKDLSAAQKAHPPFGGFLTVPVSELARIHQSPGPIYDPVGRVPDYWRWKTALYSVGFRPGDLVINTFAYHLTPAGHMLEEGVLGMDATVIPTGVGNTETQVEIIKNLGITGYIGTPSFLMAIIKKAEDMGINVAEEFKLEIGFLLAEMLPESLRKRFVDEYHLIGRQAYGTADVGGVAYECPQTNGMHVHYDVIIEICDPATGEVLPNGEPGEVVVTTNNRIYPLVRFGTGDLSSIVDEPCPCGRTSPRLTRIMGRVDQLTKIKGMFVHPSQVDKVKASHPEIERVRLLVDRIRDQDVMTLEVELTGPPGEDLVPAIEQSMRESFKLKGSVRILEPGTLAQDHKTIEDVRKWD
jgi:phenylacetate-CoA ligase